MKLKSLKNVSSAVKYEINIFTVSGDYYDTIKLNYLGDKDELMKALEKYFYYENCKVKNVSVHDDILVVSIYA